VEDVAQPQNFIRAMYLGLIQDVLTFPKYYVKNKV
jgi:hypothetical protein